jgi:hypothetical protein
MRLIVDNGLFYEFVPVNSANDENPPRHWLGDVRTDTDYVLVISSNAGLWAHVVGDTVRLIQCHPPRLLVTGRLSYFLSAFGEHLSGEEIEAAVSAAAASIGANVVDFAVGPVFPDSETSRGGHRYVMEFGEEVPSAERITRFAQAVDVDLNRRNDDYRAHRSGGFGLLPPEVIAVGHGTFAAWMRRRGQLGGQHKVPRVITDTRMFDDLCRFAGGGCG